MTQASIFITLCILWNSLPGPHKTHRRAASCPGVENWRHLIYTMFAKAQRTMEEHTVRATFRLPSTGIIIHLCSGVLNQLQSTDQKNASADWRKRGNARAPLLVPLCITGKVTCRFVFRAYFIKTLEDEFWERGDGLFHSISAGGINSIEEGSDSENRSADSELARPLSDRWKVSQYNPAWRNS